MHRNDQIQLIRKLKKQDRHGVSFRDFLNVTTHYEQVNAELRKGFGLNIEQSVKFGTQLDKISKNLDINSAKLKNYSIALSEVLTKNKAFYTSGNALSTSLLKQREAFYKLGISTEAQNKFLKISATSTKKATDGMQNMAESTAAFAQRIEILTNESGAYEDILEGIVNVGADVGR